MGIKVDVIIHDVGAGIYEMVEKLFCKWRKVLHCCFGMKKLWRRNIFHNKTTRHYEKLKQVHGKLTVAGNEEISAVIWDAVFLEMFFLLTFFNYNFNVCMYKSTLNSLLNASYR